MNKNKNARQVNYFVKRIDGVYWLHIGGKLAPLRIERKPGGWHANGVYHQTMRDAIIYCLYGV